MKNIVITNKGTLAKIAVVSPSAVPTAIYDYIRSVRSFDDVSISIYDAASDVSLVLPASVTKIGDGAFTSMTNLVSIDLNAVVYVGASAFEGLANLKTVIAKNVVTFGDNAFKKCSSLDSVTLGAVKHFGKGMFAYTNFVTSGDFKGFNPDMTAMHSDEDGDAVKFRVGRATTHTSDDLVMCRSGFHYVTNLMSVFSFMGGTYGDDFVIATVTPDLISNAKKGYKRLAKRITPTLKLTLADVVALINAGKNAKTVSDEE